MVTVVLIRSGCWVALANTSSSRRAWRCIWPVRWWLVASLPFAPLAVCLIQHLRHKRRFRLFLPMLSILSFLVIYNDDLGHLTVTLRCWPKAIVRHCQRFIQAIFEFIKHGKDLLPYLCFSSAEGFLSRFYAIQFWMSVYRHVGFPIALVEFFVSIVFTRRAHTPYKWADFVMPHSMHLVKILA